MVAVTDSIGIFRFHWEIDSFGGLHCVLEDPPNDHSFRDSHSMGIDALFQLSIGSIDSVTVNASATQQPCARGLHTPDHSRTLVFMTK